MKKVAPEQKKERKVEIGVVNAIPAQFYQKNPCMVAFNYMRLEVSGDTRACCIAKHPIGSLEKHSWREIWRSEAYSAYRSKLLNINKEHFHLTDPEYLYCQQCSHMNLNMFISRARKGEKS